jgi:hypothetical protein
MIIFIIVSVLCIITKDIIVMLCIIISSIRVSQLQILIFARFAYVVICPSLPIPFSFQLPSILDYHLLTYTATVSSLTGEEQQIETVSRETENL